MNINKTDYQIIDKSAREISILYKLGMTHSDISNGLNIPLQVISKKAMPYLRNKGIISNEDVTNHNRLVHVKKNIRGVDNVHIVDYCRRDIEFMYYVLKYSEKALADMFLVAKECIEDILNESSLKYAASFYWLIAEAYGLFTYDAWMKEFKLGRVPAKFYKLVLDFIKGFDTETKEHDFLVLYSPGCNISDEGLVIREELGKRVKIILDNERAYVPPAIKLYGCASKQLFNRICNAAHNVNVSIEQLAKETDITVDDINNIEKKFPTISMLVKICNYLNCSIDDMLGTRSWYDCE